MRRLLGPALILALAAPAHAQWMQSDGGPPPPASCVSPADRAAMNARLAPLMRARAVQGTIGSPLLDPIAGGINGAGRLVTAYVDRAGPSFTGDWSCGLLTTEGHRGTDIELPSFVDMDEGVAVLAAAGGPVVYVHDGEFDRHIAEDPGALSNAVIVDHRDGTFGWYLHLQNSSVRVGVGEWLAAGDTIAAVGSSGTSASPHLHFEISAGAAIDPFAGPCFGGNSLWQSQPAYAPTLPFAVVGHGVTTLTPYWGTVVEAPPSLAHVAPGASILSWVRTRNLKPTDLMTWRVYGGLFLWATWSGYVPVTGTSAWASTTWLLPTASSQFGPWRIEIERNGTIVAQQAFTLDAVPNLPPVVPRQVHVVAAGASNLGGLVSSDPDGATFRHEVVAASLHGALTLVGGYQRRWRYVPANGFVGLDSASVRASDEAGAWGAPGSVVFKVEGTLSVDPQSPPIALRVHPSPARGPVTIEFTIPAAHPTRLTIADAAGRIVRRIDAGARTPGPHSLVWDGRDAAGCRAPIGLYFVRLEAGGLAACRRVVLAR